MYRHGTGGLEDADVTVALGDLKSADQRAILAGRERQLVYLTPGKDGVKQMDLESGRVISGWRAARNDVDISMTDIVSPYKAAQLEEPNTFMALSNRQVMQWDMRTRDGVVASSSLASPPVLGYTAGSEYKTDMNFTCMATTGDGDVVARSRSRAPPQRDRIFESATRAPSPQALTHCVLLVVAWASEGTSVACAPALPRCRARSNTLEHASQVGNRKGEIRMYTAGKLGQAKTSFPSVGMPVTHVDVSYDGHWVVATTDSYVLARAPAPGPAAGQRDFERSNRTHSYRTRR